MSDAAATTSAADPTPFLGGLARRLRSFPPLAVALGVPALIALGICCYQFSTPNLLFSVYDGDDGVYFGEAMRLSEGLMPYKDFIIVHPPGIAVLLLPLALVGHLFGTRAGLAGARCLTVLVTTGNVVLVGLLVRYRGAFAVFSAGLFLACFPVAVAADNTLLLEPYLACLSLVGLLIAFPRGELARGWRLALGAAALGGAAAVKIWGVFPIIAIAGYLLFCHREAIARFLLGAFCGFAVICGPFFAVAPSAFVHDVVAVQWLRSRRAQPTANFGTRLIEITGLGGWNVNSPTLGVVAGALLVALLVAYFVLVRGHAPVEAVLVCGGASAAAAEFVSRDFYNHYAYFPAVYIAPLCALALSSAVRRFRVGVNRRHFQRARTGQLLGRLPWILAVVAAAVVVPANASYAASYLAASGINNPAPAIDAVIPTGTCVLSVDVVYALVSNRFTSGADCPAMDDSYGTWLSLNNGTPPPSPPFTPALVAAWANWLGQANYLIYRQTNVKVPWTPPLITWFNQHYRLVASGEYFEVFFHFSTAGGPPPGA